MCDGGGVHEALMGSGGHRRRKKRGSRRRGGNSPGREIMLTTRCSPRMPWRLTRTRDAEPTISTTSCDGMLEMKGMKNRVVCYIKLLIRVGAE